MRSEISSGSRTDLVWCFLGLALLLVILFLAGCAEPSYNRLDNYHASLMSPGGKFGALPAAVQNTVRAEAGSAEISDINKEMRNGAVMYRVDFANNGLYPPLFIAPDGSVLDPDMRIAVGAASDPTVLFKGGAASGVRITDLPQPVLKSIDEHGGRSQIALLDKETWGSRIVYIVTFKDEAHSPKLYIASDGTILRDIQK